MADKVSLQVGPVRSGKTATLLQSYRLALQNSVLANSDRTALWITPDHQSVTQVRDCLLATADEAYLGLKVETFASFAESVIAAGEKQIRPISQLQKRRLLRFATIECQEKGLISHYSQVSATPGFLLQTGEMIAELKRRDIWPEELEKRCQEQREYELAAIFTRYQQYLLDHNLYDAEGRFWAARRLLSGHSAADSSQQQYALLVVDGFTDFTSAQHDILRHLGERSAELRFALTLDCEGLESADPATGRVLLFSKTKDTLNRLQSTFPNMKVDIEGNSQFSSAGLQHLADHLFCEPHTSSESSPNCSGIEIIAASSVQQELEEVAQRIKALLSNDRVHPQEIAIVFRSLNELTPRIREVLSDYGIPHHIESQARLATCPLYRTLVSLLRLHAEDWPFALLLEVANNHLVSSWDALTTEGSTAAARASLERCIRSAQFPGGRQLLFDQLQRWIENTETSSSYTQQLSSQAQLSLQLLEPLATSFDQLPREATLSQWIRELEKLLVEIGVIPDKPFTSEIDNSTERAIHSSWQVLKRGLKAIESLDSQIESNPIAVNITGFLEILETTARDQRLPGNSNQVGCVRVFSSESARHVTVKYLFLGGLSEQSFASVAEGNPLFDVRRFDQQSIVQQSNVSEQEQLNTDSLQLFYELVTRATHQLTLSYPALDAKGQPLSPSPLLVELKRCFGTTLIPEKKSTLSDFLRSDNQPLSKAAFRKQAVARALEGDRLWLAGLLRDPTQNVVSQTIANGIQCIAERSNREEFGRFEGLFKSEMAHQILAQRFDSRHLWSASQLENYATCPFRFFGEQLLALEPPEQLALRSDVRRRGSLLHQVLASLHQNLVGAKQETTTTDLIQRFAEALAEAIDQAPLYGLQRALREIERREIEALAPQYAQQEVDYRAKWQHLDQPPEPQYFEVRFGLNTRTGNEASGDDRSAVPFELDLGEEKILLTGQIDRIDIGQVGGITVFNIIDYKSGKQARLKVDKVRSGEQLQLPLYSMAAEQLLLVEQNAMALTTGYWSVAGSGFQSGRSGALEVRQIEDRALQISEQWEQLQPELLGRVGEIVRGIRRGQFPVYNTDQLCTRNCELSTICRVAHIRSLEKQWEPPQSDSSEES